MRLLSWQELIGRFGWHRGVPRRRDRQRDDFARLSLRRLEDRRVLNGAPMGMGVTVSDAQGALVVDATQSGGQAQTFSLTTFSKDGMIELELTDNGTILFEADFASIASIEFRGGSESDVVIVDFSNGDPIPSGGISFVGVVANAGGAQADTLQFVNGTVNNVTYELSSATSGQITISVGSQTSTVQFSGTAETVTDQLAAASRSFIVDSSISQAQLTAYSKTQGMSEVNVSGGTVVDFVDPASSLSVTADPNASTTIDVHGLDSGFSASLSVTAGGGSTVDFSAATGLGNGSLNVSAGDIEVDAAVTTGSGTIELSATTQVVVSSTGALSTTANLIALSAPTITQQGIITSAEGGTVRLDAGAGGTVIESGVIDASSNVAGGTGGSVDLLGTYVGLTGQAVIDVSGSAGGGSVRIGGDFHGANAAIQNAARTYVGQDVVIDADAIDNGSGGTVVLWSEDATGFYGTINARGGAAGGDGGYVEISSRQNLDEQGLTDLSAAKGQMGTLLLDPLTITIVAASSAPEDSQLPVILFGNSPAANFSVSDIALENSTANIILQAADSITVNDLTNLAGGVLLLQPSVSVTLETRNDTTQGDTATGGITFQNTSNTIQTQGSGTITLEAGVGTGSSASVTAANLQTAGGTITVAASGDVNLEGNIASNGGAVTLIADSFGVGSAQLMTMSGGTVTGTVAVSPSVAVTTNNGTLDIKAANFVMQGPTLGALNSGTATTTIEASDCEMVGLGNATGQQITVTEAELQQIHSGSLTIGGATTGSITVDHVATDTQQGLVKLIAGCAASTLTFSGNSSSFQALTGEAAGEIAVEAAVQAAGAIGLTSSGSAVVLDGTVTSTGTGTIDLTGATGIEFDTTVSSAGGNIIFLSPVTLTGSSSVNSGGGNVAFESTVDSQANQGFDLTVNGGTTGTVLFEGAVGSAVNGRLGNLTVSHSGNVTAQSSITAAAVDLEATNGITLDGNVTTTAGDVVLGGGTGTITLANNVIVDAFGNLTMGGANGEQGLGNLTLDAGTNVLVQDTLTTAGALFVSTATGNVTIVAAVMTTGTDQSLTINAGDNVTLDGNATTTGMFSVIASAASPTGTAIFEGTVQAGGTFFATAHGITLDGNVTTTAGNVVLGGGTGTITLANNVIVDAFGNLTMGAANGEQGLGNLTLDAGTNVLVQDTLTTAGALFVSAETGNVTIVADVMTTGTNQSLTINAGDNVTLDGNATTTGMFSVIASAASPTGTAIFEGTVQAGGTFFATAHGITLDGNVTTTAGNVVLGGGTGTITLANNVIVDAFGNLTMGAANGEQGLGNLTLDAGTNVLVQDTLTTAGALFVSAETGNVTIVADVMTTGTNQSLTIIAGDNVTLDGNATTTGIFTANADSDNNGTGVFTVAAGNLVTSDNHSLSITAADLDLGGSLDSGTAVTFLHATHGEAIGLGNTVVPGGFNVSGTELGHITAAELELGDSTSGNIAVAGITAAESANIGLVVLDASGLGHSLLFTGNASTFQSITGTADADISVNAGLTATPGNVSLTSNGTLTVNQTISTQPGHNGTLTVIGGVTINAPIDVGAGNVTLKAAAGEDIIITVADVSATTIDLEAPRDIIIAALVETTSPGANIILKADTNNDGVGGVWITSTGQVDSAANVSMQGSSLYGLEFSPTPPSGSVIVDANTIPGTDSIVAAGNITIQNSPFAPAGANIVLDGAVTSTVAGSISVTSQNQIDLDTTIKSAGGNIEFHSPVLLTSPTTVISNDNGAPGGNVTFDSSVDSATATAEDLTVTAGTGNVTFTGAVGAQHEVGALRVTSAGTFLESAGITATSVDMTATNGIYLNDDVTATLGNIDWRSAVLLTNSITVAAASGNVVFHSTLNADATALSSNLTVNSGGITNFGGAVGGTTALSSLTTDAAGSTDLNGGLVTTSGAQTYNDAILLSADAALTSTGSGNVIFNKTVDGAFSLAVNTGGVTTFDGAVGGTTALTSLTTDAAGSTHLNGGSVTTSGAQTYNDAVLLSANTVLTSTGSGNVTFGATLDSQANQGFYLTIDAGTTGAVLFEGAVGGAANGSLGNLTVSHSGNITAQGTLTAGTIDLAAANGITLEGNATATAASPNGTFTANADSDGNGSGTFTLGQNVAVQTNSSALHITAANFLMQGPTLGMLDSGTAATTIEASDCETVGLRSATGQNITITQAELQQIHSGSLTIGGTNTASITIDGVTTDGQQGHVTLIAGCAASGITFSGGDSAFAALTGTAVSFIDVNAGLAATPGEIFLDSNGTLTVNQTISTQPGAGGKLTITGGVVVNAAIDVGAGNVTLIAATGEDIIVTVGDISATTIDLEAPRDIIIAALVETTNPGSNIILKADADNDGVGGVWITSTGRVVSAADVSIQGSNLYGLEFSPTPPSGSIIVDANAVPGTDSIVATGNITIQNSPFAPAGANIVLEGAVTSTMAGNIGVTSQNQIELDTTVATAGGNVAFHSPVILTGNSKVMSGGGFVAFDSTVDSAAGAGYALTVDGGTTGDVTFDAAVGGALNRALGNLTVGHSGNVTALQSIQAATVLLSATNNITLGGNVTTTGTFTANADVDAGAGGDGSGSGLDSPGQDAGNGVFTVAAAKTVVTGNHAILISAADVNLAGSLNSGTQTTTIEAADGESIGLGTGSVDLLLSQIELSHITSGNLVIGSSAATGPGTTGNIVADGVTTNGQQGAVTLLTQRGGATITFGSSGNSFAALAANANAGMSVQGNVTTTGISTNGDLSLHAGSGNIAFSAGVTLSGAGNISLTAGGAGGLVANGALTLLAGQDLQVKDALTAPGALTVKSTSGSVDFQKSVSTTGASTPLQIKAGTDITLEGNVTTTGAMTAQAGNNITQANGTTIDAGSAPVSLAATTGNVTLLHVVTTNTVVVQAGGAISNGLIPSAGENITAAAAGLSAGAGIGNGQPLETMVSTLAAKNSSSGNIVVNNVGGALTIGIVGSVGGIENDASLGSISVTNDGALTIDPPILATKGGNIVLTSTNGPANDLTLNAQVRATGGNGNVVLTAGTNLVVNASGSGPDIQTQGNGTIVGLAQNVVIFNGPVLIQSGVGAITQLFPNVTNVLTPEITAEGIATISGSDGEPSGAHYYTVVVDWHDGTTSTETFAGPSSFGSFVLSHFYSTNPDAVNKSAPIPVTVTVFDDPNSTFIGLHQPAVTTPLSETSSQTVGNGFHTVNSQFTVPGEGLGFINIAMTAVVVPDLRTSPPTTLQLSPVIVPVQINPSQYIGEQSSQFEDVALEERQVILQVIGPDGKVTEQVVVEEQVLDDLPAFFRKLPDGHYRILLKDSGEVNLRLLLDVHLRGGKPVDESEEGQGISPAAEGEAAPGVDAREAVAAPLDSERESRATANESSVAGLPSAREDAWLSRAKAAAAAAVDAVPFNDGQVTDAAPGPTDATDARSRTGYAGLLAGGALVACVGDGWQERVDAALAAAGPQALSKLSRLSRRLRRPLAREAGGRLIRRRRGGSERSSLENPRDFVEPEDRP